MLNTPQSMRMTIAVFGRTNSGKSSLVNAILGEDVSLVSEVRGTTTDPVKRPTELYPIGPCLFIDTAGFDDETELGKLRTDRTKKVLERADMAILVIAANDEITTAQKWADTFIERNIKAIGVLNKSDLLEEAEKKAAELSKILKIPFVAASALAGVGIDKVKTAIIENAPRDFELPSIIGHLVSEGDSVLLVMPQDIQAPKGRLILPQVQVTRDLLDHGAVITSVTADKLEDALKKLKEPPKLIITDSQVFPFVYERKPKESKLTSFSVLLARYKGDISAFLKGTEKIDTLTEKDRVLIAEACSHNPLDGDIGRIKIPNLLRKKIGEKLKIDIVGGSNFPEDLSPYALVVHCGGCMFNRRYMLNRIREAKEQNVPITNYGMLIAKLSGILDKITIE